MTRNGRKTALYGNVWVTNFGYHLFATMYIQAENFLYFCTLVQPSSFNSPSTSLLCTLGTIPILRQQRDWVCGSEKWHFLLTLSTIYADVGWLGGSEKVPKCADVIYRDGPLKILYAKICLIAFPDSTISFSKTPFSST